MFCHSEYESTTSETEGILRDQGGQEDPYPQGNFSREGSEETLVDADPSQNGTLGL